MARSLLLFVDSQTIDVYVNVLTHCVRKEDVKQIYFVGDEVSAGREFELYEFLKRVYERVEQLTEIRPEIYLFVQASLPDKVEDRVIRISYANPQGAIPQIKKRFPDTANLLIDITGCEKKLAGDVITSFMTHDVDHVCYFQLSDPVYTKEWEEAGRDKIYHDLVATESKVPYYTYVDFSKSYPTISSFNRLRAQGRLVRGFLLVSIVLVILVLVFLYQQQLATAQWIAFVAFIATVLTYLESVVSWVERAKRWLT